MPQLICIASDFTKYDEYAVKQINRNISLIRYKKYENELLLFELINSKTVKEVTKIYDKIPKDKENKKPIDKSFLQQNVKNYKKLMME